jgi:hypothetical protein
MKKITHLISRTALFACLLMLPVYSCKKFVTVPPPLSEATSASVFSSDQSANAAALGVYEAMNSSLNLCYGASTVFPALSADELNYNSSNTEYKEYQENELTSANDYIYGDLWAPPFRTIYAANSVIAGLAAATQLSDSVKNQLEGEMLVTRSLNYFYLVNLFGAVPLETTPDYQLNSQLARSGPGTIYAQLSADLLKAMPLLSAAPSNLNARPNKWAAEALLARVYLYQGKWAAAAAAASAVINANTYQLEPDPDNVFLEGSSETIWQLANDYNNTPEGSAFIPYSASSTPTYSLTTSLLAAFEPGDLRAADWIGENTIKGTAYYYPYKYKNRSYGTVTEYEVILRLAEQYLIRAEARAELGQLTDGLADLNVVRARAGLNPTTAGDEGSLLSAIYAERRVELFCEWGHRFLDLKRIGKADTVLGAEKPNWSTNDQLYPIPLDQLNLDNKLTQNPGYQ